ncbi:MAG TPA: hypothetical protein VG166_01125 [Caulobacteraceae bacterium]|nr:hypothetical protein [Caulobacteraceae bacterium]
MIKFVLGRVALALAAAAVLATSAAIVVIALAFALYALVRPSVGPAGAAAIVAGGAALILLIAALALALAARVKRRGLAARGKDPAARLMNLVREKPVTTIAAAIGAGFLAVRNPKYLGAALRSFLEGPPAADRRRR